MATDDERRAVARRLRGIKDTREGCGHDLCCDLWEAVFDSDYRCDELCDECEVAVLYALADLIEPEPERTYHPERIGTAYHSALMCSACKYSLDEVTVYCPHCGARLEGVSHGKR